MYARALQEPLSIESSWTLCQVIRDVDLQGDCQVVVLDRLQETSMFRCESIGSPLWQEECMFLTAERLWSAGTHPGALAACQQTRFARACLWHLLQDEAEAVAGLSAAQAEQHLALFSGVQRQLPDAGRQFWSIWFRLQAQHRQAVDATVCDTVSTPTVCLDGLDVYTHDVLTARQRAGNDPCPAPAVEGWVDGTHLRDSLTRWVEHHCPQTP